MMILLTYKIILVSCLSKDMKNFFQTLNQGKNLQSSSLAILFDLPCLLVLLSWSVNTFVFKNVPDC